MESTPVAGVDGGQAFTMYRWCMVRVRAVLGWLLAAVAVLVGVATASASAAGEVRGVVLNATIDPASGQFVTRRIEDAARDQAAVFIIEMDTPGGLSTSMHDIVKAIETSTVPVVVWVGPSGSRAGSAGAYISAASDRLLMAPGTNIGSATPVSGASGQDLEDKIVNDAAAQITALATAHGRNGDAFRSMVTEQKNFPAEEAVRLKIAEGVAATRAEVVASLDGLTLHGQQVRTAGAPVQIQDMPWYLRLLQILIDPNLIAILFGLGLAAIGFEIFHPGAIVPGVVGVIFILLAFLGLSVVPFNWAGLTFIGLAFILFALEATVSGFGALALGGIASLVIGGLILFDDAKGPAVSRPGLVVLSVVIGTGFTLIARTAWRAHRRPHTTGGESMAGHVGDVRSAVSAEAGSVFVNGELWAARTAPGTTIPVGAHVRVTAMHDLTLVVEPQQQEQA